ncbi:hypothetical protein [Variovorax paradoxus]|uniref:hypothetical protein n=1 Tax=Variovorax paradoxus TaxID=34073 RepID=UPI003D6588C9
MKKPPPALCTVAPMLALLLAGQVFAAPAAQPFDVVRKPESVDPDWRARLCALLPQPCDPQSLGLYRPRGTAAGDYAVLSDEPLAMAMVRIKRGADSRTWQLARLHDFSSHAAALKKDGAGMPEARVSLAPAFYPLAEGQWAVAVLQTVSEMYSGGGASFTKADFVPLDESKAAYDDIPFSCSKMVRACFSEKEYKQSRHCHDESSGSLRIAYGEPARPGEPYNWQFTWLQSDWPAHTPASAATTTRLHFAARTTERAGFCGGPQ